jgi:1,4-alpha-glucan branching enzyme
VSVTTRFPARRVLPLLLAVAVLAGGCSSMNFVKRRLPPPTRGPGGVTFRFFSPSAQRVQLAGSWPENDWLRGLAQTGGVNIGLMEENPAGSGTWVLTVKLPPGRYQYKFVVDGVNWKEDPNNPQWTDDGYGGHNSVVDVH